MYNQLAKIGTGTLTLWGENAYKGGTVISNGTLTVNNYINTNGWVAVYPQGTLDGIGTVGIVSNLGGTVRGSIHTPSLVLGSGSTVEAVLNGATPVSEYSQLSVQGAVDLNNSTLLVTLGFAPVVGQTFTILNGSSVIGQFASGGKVTALYNGRTYDFSITNTGSAVVLTVIPQGTTILIR